MLKLARDELDGIRRSRGDPSKDESREKRDRRIVQHGEGYTAQEVAIWGRCGIGDVRRARAARANKMAADGMPARSIAFALGLSYSSVLRMLGRKA